MNAQLSVAFEPFRTLHHQLMKEYPSPSCERNWGNLVLYQAPYKSEFCQYGRHLSVVYGDGKALLFPLGEFLPPSELADLVRIIRNDGRPVEVIFDLPEEYLTLFDGKVTDFFEIDGTEDEFDYLYDCQHLATMSGPILRKRRNQLKHFMEETSNLRLIDITPDNLPRVIDFAIRQDEAQPDKDFLQREIMAMNAMRSNWQECGLQGFFVTGGGDETIGFSIFSPTSDKVMDVHFEKASRNFHGAAQFICCETARRAAAQKFEYLNREQDMGEAGLRHSKRALDPAMMFKRFNLTPKF